MAHHIFRRCLLADVVPPVPPPVVEGGDYRLVVAAGIVPIMATVSGIEFGASVAGLDVMSALAVMPIPPGVDTGLGYYRIDAASGMSVVYNVAPVEIHGSLRTSGAII